MKAQLEKRLAELRAEYETGQKIFKDIEAKFELEKENNLNETLLRISGQSSFWKRFWEKIVKTKSQK